MPSVPHEMLIELLAKSPQLLPPLLGDQLEAVTELDPGLLHPSSLCIRSGQSTASQLPVLWADLGLELYRPATTHPATALTVEIQLTQDEDKPYSWIPYLGGQYHRLHVPAYLLVVTNDPVIAAWAAGPFRAGHLTLEPWVLGPADVPAITTLDEARQSLDMALFSGIVHGRERAAVPIGLALRQALDEAPDDVGLYYWDAFIASLSAPVRKELDMQIPEFTPRSDWSKDIFAKGLAAGEAKGLAAGEAKGLAEGEAKGLTAGEAHGRAKDILLLLELRRLAITPRQRRLITQCTNIAQLDRWFRNAVTAKSIDAVLAPEPSPRPASKPRPRRALAPPSRPRELPRG